jgi:hypothetical protein
VLRAYFDESGIHGGSRTTILSGFIGSRNQWRRIAVRWQKAMKGEIFHYQKMRLERALLERLANILGESGVEAISAGFLGDWDRAIHSGAPDWPTRFPSCYQFIFEVCVQQMEKHSKLLWNGEPVALIFSRQDQYAKFAEEIWRKYKDGGQWASIAGFGYGDPSMPELQTADMIAHEVFQCTRQVYEIGQSASPNIWQNWPLIRRLTESRRMMFGSSFSEETLVETLREQDKNRVYFSDFKKS